MRDVSFHFIRRGQTIWYALIIIVLSVSILAGCGTEQELPPGRESGSKPLPGETPGQENSKIVLYFADEEAMYLTPEIREVQLSEERTTAEVIIEELIKGPKYSGHYRTLPETTQLLSVKESQGIAYVNLSQRFEKDFSGGTTGEFMALGSIIRSLTELPSIDAVQFLIEGKNVEVLQKGHSDISSPVERVIPFGALEQTRQRSKNEQKAVEQGNNKWRLDPLSTAKTEGPLYGLYVNGEYRLISPDDANEGSGTGEALVRHTYKGKVFDILLIQPVKTGPEGIWVINAIMPCAAKDEAIIAFLEGSFNKPVLGGKVFSSYKILGEKPSDYGRFVYIWVLSEEYMVKDGTLVKGREVSIPLSLILYSQDEEHNGVIYYQTPEDGENYTTDLERIFPADIQKKIADRQVRVVDLQEENLWEARKYFANSL